MAYNIINNSINNINQINNIYKKAIVYTIQRVVVPSRDKKTIANENKPEGVHRS